MGHQHPANVALVDNRTRAEWLADEITSLVGSWPFLIVMTFGVLVWLGLNISAWNLHWDPYPFILLNLAFSVQAAYTGPLVLLSSNRAAEHDRRRAEHAYATTDEILGRLTALQEEHADLRRDHRNYGEALAVMAETWAVRQDALAEVVDEVRALVKPPARRPAPKRPPAKPKAT